MRPSLFILLLALVSHSLSQKTCPDVVLVNECAADKDFLCGKPNKGDDNKPPSCPASYDLQVLRGNPPSFESIKKVDCIDGTLSGSRKDGGMKMMDIDAVRCVRKACKVKTNELGGNGNCEEGHICGPIVIENKKDLKCHNGFSLYGRESGGKQWMPVDTVECYGEETFPVKGGSAIAYKQLRCSKPMGCDLSINYIAHDCNDNTIECATPTADGNKNLKCNDDYEIQAKSDVWHATQTIKCDNGIVFKAAIKGIKTIIKSARCVRKNTGSIEYKTDIKLGETCEKPKGYKPMKCEKDFNMEIRESGAGEEWKRVKSIFANSDKFKVKHVDDSDVALPTLDGIRCVKSMGCDLSNNYDPFDCDITSDCNTPTLGHNNALKCEADYDLQAKGDVGQWEAVAITCNKRAFIAQIGGKKAVIKSARCVRKKEVDHETDCELGEICEKPEGYKPMTCAHMDATFNLEIRESGAWERVKSVSSNSDKFKVKHEDDSVVALPTLEGIRCVKTMGCELSNNYDPLDCDITSDCNTPTLDNNNALKCEADYEPQAKDKFDRWEAVAITCNQFAFIAQIGGAKAVIKSARCVRKMPVAHDTDCKPEEECKTATGYDPMICETNFNLQIRSGGTWEGVKSISTNSDKFKVKKEDDSDDAIPTLEGIRCVRLKCSICTLPTCPSCASSVAGEWNKCASFGCGPSSRTMIGKEIITEDSIQCSADNKEGESFWLKDDKIYFWITDEVKCEKLCTKKDSPVTSTCEPDDNLCETITFDDDKEIKCDGHLVQKSKPEKKGTKLECDKTVGEWKFTTKDEGEISVDAAENIYCMYDDCSIVTLCPECKEEKNSPKLFSCPDERKITKISHASNGTNEIVKPSPSFTCKTGKWIDNKGNEMAATDAITCLSQADIDAESRKASSAGSDLIGLYIIVLVIVISLIVLLLVALVCKMKGNGWLHVIILDKIRGKKNKKGKKEKTSRKESKKASSKGNSSVTSGKVTSVNTDKETNDQNQSPSGEKVSAEQLSQTGGAVSAEQTGGAVIPNEPIDPMGQPGQIVV